MFDSTSSDDETIISLIEPTPTINPLPRSTGKHILLESSSNSSSDTDGDIETDKARSGNKQDSKEDDTGHATAGVNRDNIVKDYYKSDDSNIDNDNDNQDKVVANDNDDNKKSNEQDNKNDNDDMEEQTTNIVQATQSDPNTDQTT